jgi:hypothetical protein
MYALENPWPGKLSKRPISKLGLLVVEPNAIDKTEDGRIAYLGSITYQDIPRDDRAFLAFLDEVLTTLEQPAPPPPAENCPWCQYRASARENML